VQTDFSNDTIALHLFDKGYCGLVKVEDDKYNLCYLTTADNLHDGDIEKMEETILSRNPFLKKIFSESKKCTEPFTISQISFDKKLQVENHVLMIGDAAGMITPLCGNGMSMALHGSKIAAKQIQSFLEDRISRDEMEKIYTLEWKRQFAGRLQTGRRIQRLFGNELLTNLLMASGRRFPSIIRFLIKQTHGKPF
jgi:menaquinone-9 beta-reductase